MNKSPETKKGLIDRGFDLDRRLNVAVAVGAVAVGALLPPLAVPAGVVAAGSIAAIPASDRLRSAIKKKK